MAKQIKNTQAQAFVICPLIEESDKETLQSVRAAKSEFEKLKEIFPNLKLGLIHGRQSAKEKNSQIEKFKKGKTDILVATPVVEVGIDVPAASIMIIEGAQRFGLAALHQLRGRIGRGRKKSYCLLFPEDPSVKATARLEALKTTRSGFELAEMDLKLRGPGEIFGTAQSGFPELKIASWSDIDLIRLSKEVAQEIS
jgi:ATP-dependent DNA helicase RecG